ncbi:Aste57867_23180 [Aphanomyces stellatus]|uniref:Aste57867_23180 protein n=1 Tax=Aphanomyces stellatus TaxID=120398 RepID=A0A485LM94_9STRA|nr:hypothetical protein As57867_023109 [Aphanomyces stellatus]VFT99828.1 Aste57867_23180 [Aphanomyces stellatus]
MQEPTSRRQLGLVSVALITFFSVCGGPFGSEPIVSACGPLIGLSALVVFPLVYSLPMNLLLAELYSAFPVDSSFCTWVDMAFGSPWGFYVGYWSWIASTFDAAVYPCLVTDSLFLHTEATYATKTLVRILLLTLFMAPTLFSINFVGKTSMGLAILVFAPFVLLILFALPQMNLHALTVVSPTMNYTQLIGVLFWNFRGFDAMGAYAGEILNPKVNFHKAMLVSLVLISLTYTLPLVAAAAVNRPNYSTWTDGAYPAIARAIGGDWLAIWVALSNTVSSFGLYMAEATANGFRLAGMADAGLVPHCFAIRDDATGSPRRSIVFIYVLSIGMCCFDFSTILGVTNALSILAQVVPSCAALTMRVTHPDIHRPYQVGLSTPALVAAIVLPIALAIAIFINQLCVNGTTLALTCAAVVLGGIVRCVLMHKSISTTRVGYAAIDKV